MIIFYIISNYGGGGGFRNLDGYYRDDNFTKSIESNLNKI